MPTYQIEMLWTCSVCKSADNRGLHKHCSNCGKPKGEGDEERFPDDISEANALSGEDQLKALAGPDWKCKYCNTLQNSRGKCCVECGCDKSTGAKPWSTEEQSVTENIETGQKKFGRRKPAIVFDPFRASRADAGPVEEGVPPVPDPFKAPERDFIPDTGGYRDAPEIRDVTPTPVAVDASEMAPLRPRRMPDWLPKLAGSVAIAGVLFFLLWLIFRTKVVDASVTGVSWQHDVIVDRYQVYRREGWDTDPGAFEVQDQGRRVHHYDHVQVGSHQESYSESYTCGQNCTTVRGTCTTSPRRCTSNKNGTANCSGGDRTCSPDTQSCTPKTCSRTAYRTVPEYQDQPRYRDWYTWKVWDWGYNRTVRAAGTTTKTRWPEFEELLPPSPLAQGEQERSGRTAAYSVSFQEVGGKDIWTIKPRSIGDFEGFEPGRRFKLKVGLANGVTILGRDGSSTDY